MRHWFTVLGFLSACHALTTTFQGEIMEFSEQTLTLDLVAIHGESGLGGVGDSWMIPTVNGFDFGQQELFTEPLRRNSMGMWEKEDRLVSPTAPSWWGYRLVFGGDWMVLMSSLTSVTPYTLVENRWEEGSAVSVLDSGSFSSILAMAHSGNILFVSVEINGLGEKLAFAIDSLFEEELQVVPGLNCSRGGGLSASETTLVVDCPLGVEFYSIDETMSPPFAMVQRLDGFHPSSVVVSGPHVAFTESSNVVLYHRNSTGLWSSVQVLTDKYIYRHNHLSGSLLVVDNGFGNGLSVYGYGIPGSSEPWTLFSEFSESLPTPNQYTRVAMHNDVFVYLHGEESFDVTKLLFLTGCGLRDAVGDPCVPFLLDDSPPFDWTSVLVGVGSFVIVVAMGVLVPWSKLFKASEELDEDLWEQPTDTPIPEPPQPPSTSDVRAAIRAEDERLMALVAGSDVDLVRMRRENEAVARMHAHADGVVDESAFVSHSDLDSQGTESSYIPGWSHQPAGNDLENYSTHTGSSDGISDTTSYVGASEASSVAPRVRRDPYTGNIV